MCGHPVLGPICCEFYFFLIFFPAQLLYSMTCFLPNQCWPIIRSMKSPLNLLAFATRCIFLFVLLLGFANPSPLDISNFTQCVLNKKTFLSGYTFYDNCNVCYCFNGKWECAAGLQVNSPTELFAI